MAENQDPKNSVVMIGDSTDAFHASVYEEEGIVYAKQVGYLELESAERLVKIYTDLRIQRSAKLLFLLDMSELKHASIQARRLMTRTVLGKDSPFSKFAAVGGGFWVRNMARLVSRIAPLPMRHFNSTPEAVAWLKEATDENG